MWQCDFNFFSTITQAWALSPRAGPTLQSPSLTWWAADLPIIYLHQHIRQDLPQSVYELRQCAYFTPLYNVESQMGFFRSESSITADQLPLLRDKEWSEKSHFCFASLTLWRIYSLHYMLFKKSMRSRAIKIEKVPN